MKDGNNNNKLSGKVLNILSTHLYTDGLNKESLMKRYLIFEII